MEDIIRIVLANHHPIIRSDLRLLLERQPTFHVIGEAANGREAVVLMEYKQPDVILLDVSLPHVNGMAASREISSKSPSSGIIFVTALTDEEYISEAFKAGARGYVLEDAAQTDLPFAIRVVAAGRRFLSPAICEKLIEDYATECSEPFSMPEHEKHVCGLLAAGYSESEIATHLNSDANRVRSDLQAADEALQRIKLPQVIIDLIRVNHLIGHS